MPPAAAAWWSPRRRRRGRTGSDEAGRHDGRQRLAGDPKRSECHRQRRRGGHHDVGAVVERARMKPGGTMVGNGRLVIQNGVNATGSGGVVVTTTSAPWSNGLG